jgi:hypothetical protein
MNKIEKLQKAYRDRCEESLIAGRKSEEAFEVYDEVCRIEAHKTQEARKIYDATYDVFTVASTIEAKARTELYKELEK